MLRHGYARPPIHWREVHLGGQHNPRGIYVVPDEYQRPDLVIYYLHGVSEFLSIHHLYFALFGSKDLVGEGTFGSILGFSLQYFFELWDTF